MKQSLRSARLILIPGVDLATVSKSSVKTTRKGEVSRAEAIPYPIQCPASQPQGGPHIY
ncbi:MAG: hypothetical protein QW059_04255 [Nitrososphaerota archaeon]